MMYEYGVNGVWFGHTLFGGLFMIIFWVAVVLFIVWAVRQLSDNGRKDNAVGRGNAALDTLKERYAKGEIDKKEFEEKKKDLAN